MIFFSIQDDLQPITIKTNDRVNKSPYESPQRRPKSALDSVRAPKLDFCVDPPSSSRSARDSTGGGSTDSKDSKAMTRLFENLALSRKRFPGNHKSAWIHKTEEEEKQFIKRADDDVSSEIESANAELRVMLGLPKIVKKVN